MTRILGGAVGLLLLGGLCWWFGIDELAVAVRRLDAGMFLLYLSLYVVVLLGYCLRWQLVTRALGSTVPIRSLIVARLAGDAVGSLIPSAKLAGEPVRMTLVRGPHVSGADAAAGVALDRVFEVIGNILVVLAYVATFVFLRNMDVVRSTPLVLVVALLLVLTALALLLISLSRGKRPFAFLYGRRARRAMPRLSGWMDGLERSEGRLVGLLRCYPRIVPVGILASLGIEALIIVEYHFLLKAFGLDLDLSTLLLVLLGSGAARAAPTPAGLGALEAGQVALLTLAAGEPSTRFVVGMVLRLHETLSIGAGLLALSFRGVSLARLRSLSAESGATA